MKTFFRPLTLSLVLFPLFLFAAEVELGPPRPSASVSAFDFLQLILGIFTKMAIPALVGLIVFFGFRLVSAMGDERSLEEAKRHLWWAIIVAAIFLGLRLLNTIVFNMGEALGYVGMLIVAGVGLLFYMNRS